MPKKIENMTDDELVAENRRLMTEKEKIRERQREVNREQTARVARARVDEMSDEEQRELYQELQARGIPSEEVAGTPGAG